MTKIMMAMSGGVDSSVAAALLLQQGYEVEGLYMKNWESNSSDCPSKKDFADVVSVCNKLGIKYHHVNFSKEYWRDVFKGFLNDFEKGLTPNPDILCNKHIKFKVLLDKAIELGADKLATGHYCQTETIDGVVYLKKGLDPKKDQSYFLSAINSKALEKVLFPLGSLKKTRVRKIATELDLATKTKKDSMGICFIGEKDFTGFIADYIHCEQGEFKTLDGTTVGNHLGQSFYTIGQRKGLGLGGPGEPWFVVEKDLVKNIVYVERGVTHPALFADKLWANEIHWITKAPNEHDQLTAKIRYRQVNQDCKIKRLENNDLEISFSIPQRAITPGQTIAFYNNDLCIGSATILKAEKSFYHQNKALPEIITREI